MSVVQSAGSAPSTARQPQTFSIIADGRRKVHTTYPDKSEKVEEYDLRDDTILVRKFRRPNLFGTDGTWDYEIGAPRESGAITVETSNGNDMIMAPSVSSPFCVTRDTKDAFEWRIRNLPFPSETYSVQIDGETREIVIRTTNKKYFKRLRMSDVQSLGLDLKPESLSWCHQHNTLIVSYKKPPKILELEKKRAEEAKRVALNAN
ncbi:DPCD family protein [Besnoitia besnoiti]|uniref:Protein DPCD n=1 Tax=Besnoitia besnoiti TaxID=94643 RepID=A0A2A9MGF6_BESBE|nr:DPCD family protein [Besnoitia besnoiti]PFH36999.1 DPCD family protein [Besnoitia besnoiti]